MEIYLKICFILVYFNKKLKGDLMTTITTIYSSLSYFSKNCVDLDPESLEKSRRSRKWLVGKIEEFPEDDITFPKIYTKENDVQMGSFSRRTKIRPIDDIDFMVVFSAEGTTYGTNGFTGKIELNVPESATALKSLCNEFAQLNSIKILNKLKSKLSTIPQYSQADLKRNQEAITLKLQSYPWNFDIVPAFITSPESDGRSYYLIPDGSGSWKKTDPRIDSKRTSTINQLRNGKVLKYIRLIKYWQKRPIMPTISSYLLENLILNYFESNDVGTDQSTLRDIFKYLKVYIYHNVDDPKGIQGNLNNLEWETKNKIAIAASLAESYAQNAIDYSLADDHKSAHDEWKKIFGSEFPNYE
jgi:hypothetical protein